MQRIRIGVFWKTIVIIYASTILSSLIMYLMYTGFSPLTKLHPRLQEALVNDTRSIAGQLNTQLEDSSKSPEDIIRQYCSGEEANLKLFDDNGRELASCMEGKGRVPSTIPQALIEQTFKNGLSFQVEYLRLVLTPVVSVPITIPNNKCMILRNYYPVTKGFKGSLPRGLPEIIGFLILSTVTLICSRYITNPLRKLNRIAQEVVRGNFGIQFKIRSHDEVGQLAQTFNTLSSRLAELKISRREMFAEISHELRSPLARILTDAEILMDRQMNAKENEQHLRAICTEVENLDCLIGDLSTLAQFEQNQVEISIQRASLSDVILQAVSLFIPQMEEKGINLKQYISKEVGSVMIDPIRIGQVVSNILMNAIRYTPAGGTIEVGLTQRGSMAEVWVKDSGEGIPPEKIPFIFERFYRVDQSRSRSTGGSGLGLAIARQFIKYHGGDIRAESNLGEGTRITFRLPKDMNTVATSET